MKYPSWRTFYIILPTNTQTNERCWCRFLNARCPKKYTDTDASLADLYAPLSMPPDLLTAHDALDKAVDDCYGKTRFTSDAKRVAFLFKLYDGLVKGENEMSLKNKK